MGIFRRENLFCTICKKSITHKQKAKQRWNIEGYLCGDCYVDEMKKQYEIEEEIKHKNYEKNSEVLPKPQKIKAEKSTKSIKISYYFTILSLIVSPIMIIYGLIYEYQFTWILGIFILFMSIIQFPKHKKQFDGLSKIDDEPLDVLKMRLAKGEITKDEFDKIKEDITD